MRVPASEVVQSRNVRKADTRTRTSGLASWNACGAHAVLELVLLSSRFYLCGGTSVYTDRYFFLLLFDFIFYFLLFAVPVATASDLFYRKCVLYMQFTRHVMAVIINTTDF